MIKSQIANYTTVKLLSALQLRMKIVRFQGQVA